MREPTYGPSALATPANAITIARVLATPLLVALILGENTEWLALVFWIVLASTDGADGFVARRQGTTRSGAFLDPLADKVIVLGALWALESIDRVFWVPVALITVREVVLSLYRSYVGRRGVSVPARALGKAKTVVQIVAVSAALLPVDGTAYEALVALLLWSAVALTLASGAQYLLDGRRVALAG